MADGLPGFAVAEKTPFGLTDPVRLGRENLSQGVPVGARETVTEVHGSLA